jgi:hypothetical protein
MHKSFFKRPALLSFYESEIGDRGDYHLAAVARIYDLTISQAACFASLIAYKANPDNDLGGPGDGKDSYTYD